MSSRVHHLLLLTCLAFGSLLVGACQGNRHSMTDTATGKTLVCKECFDAVAAAHRSHPASTASGTQTLSTSTCPCCKTEMAVYIQDGTHMVKCGGCAPDGVAWDRCIVRSSATE